MWPETIVVGEESRTAGTVKVDTVDTVWVAVRVTTAVVRGTGAVEMLVVVTTPVATFEQAAEILAAGQPVMEAGVATARLAIWTSVAATVELPRADLLGMDTVEVLMSMLYSLPVKSASSSLLLKLPPVAVTVAVLV